MGERLDRPARVFVSSTFHDMHHERDILVRSVFPRLRERLAGAGVALFEVDLRWGITQELAEARGVLQLCLEEVDACTPLFLCMPGEYYGTRLSHDELRTLSTDRARTYSPAAPPSITEGWRSATR